MLPPDKLAARYVLKCSSPNCVGILRVDQNYGAGWKIGDKIPMDPSNPAYGRCPQCKRHNMTVTEGPPPPAPKKPKGFTKVPTE